MAVIYQLVEVTLLELIPECGVCQRCGAKVILLEARQDVGGRVRGSDQAAFTVPVDLGASIITGTRADLIKGLRPDPSTIIARCLHLLQSAHIDFTAGSSCTVIRHCLPTRMHPERHAEAVCVTFFSASCLPAKCN